MRIDMLRNLLGIPGLQRRLDAIARGVSTIAQYLATEGVNMATTVADLNTKLDELIKDVRRVLQLVQDNPTGAATQEEVDALAERLDALDAEAEAVSPEPTDPNA